jgi:hypothetical protein
MKYFKILLIALLHSILVSSSCKKESSYYDYRLKVVNNSKDMIYADFYQSYPDTTLSSNSHFDGEILKARPNDTITLIRGGSWENAFSSDITEKLMVYVFDAEIIEDTPWDTVKANYMVLKRYDLSLQELEKMNWTISYP